MPDSSEQIEIQLAALKHELKTNQDTFEDQHETLKRLSALTGGKAVVRIGLPDENPATDLRFHTGVLGIPSSNELSKLTTTLRFSKVPGHRAFRAQDFDLIDVPDNTTPSRFMAEKYGVELIPGLSASFRPQTPSA